MRSLPRVHAPASTASTRTRHAAPLDRHDRPARSPAPLLSALHSARGNEYFTSAIDDNDKTRISRPSTRLVSPRKTNFFRSKEFSFDQNPVENLSIWFLDATRDRGLEFFYRKRFNRYKNARLTTIIEEGTHQEESSHSCDSRSYKSRLSLPFRSRRAKSSAEDVVHHRAWFFLHSR